LSLASIFLPGLLALGFLALPGEWKTQVANALFAANEGQILAVAASVLVVADVALFLAATARFQRARLILD
jgi:hypothetical protein